MTGIDFHLAQYVKVFIDSVTEILPDTTQFRRNCALFFLPNYSHKEKVFFPFSFSKTSPIAFANSCEFTKLRSMAENGQTDLFVGLIRSSSLESSSPHYKHQ